MAMTLKQLKTKTQETMKTEENKRMEALAYIIADLKAENIEMTQRVHQLTDVYNDAVRQQHGLEERKDENSSKQTLDEMLKMRDHCDELERENKKLNEFEKEIHAFIEDKKLYLIKGEKCTYYAVSDMIGCTSCLECSSCLGVIEGLGVICKKRLADATVSFPRYGRPENNE